MDDQQKSGGEKADEIVLPGFRFHPTDEELVGFYLKRKIQQRPLSIELIKQLDIYKFDPWDLPKLATTGEKEWYFYCPRDRKYRNSTRPNRVTKAGFWKATGTDRPVYSSEGSKCIGLKKSLVFYKGRAAKGVKTDWMMHEFRLPSMSDPNLPKIPLEKTLPTSNESWAICRIFKKSSAVTQRTNSRSWISPCLPRPSHVLNPKTCRSPHQDQTIIKTNTFVEPKPLSSMQINPNGEFYANEVVDNSSTPTSDLSFFDMISSYQQPSLADCQSQMMLPPLMDASLPDQTPPNKRHCNNGDISCVIGDYLGSNNFEATCMNLEGLHDEFIINNGEFSFESLQEMQGGMEFGRGDDLWDVVKSIRLPINAASEIEL